MSKQLSPSVMKSIRSNPSFAAMFPKCPDCFGSGQRLGKEHLLGEVCPTCAGMGIVRHE